MNALTLTNLVTFYLILLSARASTVRFSTDGGQIMKDGDDIPEAVNLRKPIPLWNSLLGRIFVSPNGGILSTRFTRTKADDAWSFFGNTKALLPYWSDGLCQSDACVTTFKYCNDDDLDLIHKIINNKLNLSKNVEPFKANANLSIVISYENVSSYDSKPDGSKAHNTFQTVITSDGQDTYAIFSYNEITYPTDTFAPRNKPKIGYYINQQRYCHLSYSGTLDGDKLTCSTNAYMDGVFVFGLTPSAHFQCDEDENAQFYDGHTMEPSCSKCSGNSVSNRVCTAEYTPVCGSDGKTYSNLCTLESEKCNNTDLMLVSQGECDHNECEGNHECHANARCINTEGSYRCECYAGYKGNGFVCTDEDECEASKPVCHSNATCQNTIGSFECQCKDGFNGNGFDCSEINECTDEPCQNGQVCEDLVGNYTCRCSNVWTGRNCEIYAPCSTNNGGCEESCGTPNATRPNRCTCRRRPIDTDYQSCRKDNFLLVAVQGGIAIDNPELINQEVPELVDGEDITLVTLVGGLDYDYEKGEIYYIDVDRKNIMKIHINRTFPVVVASANRGGGSDYGDLAYDPTTDNIYWVENQSIYVFDGKDVKQWHAAVGSPKIRSLAIVPEKCQRRLYWTQYATDVLDISAKVGIMYRNLDNENDPPVHIVSEWISTPLGLAVDHENQTLYWSETTYFDASHPNGIYKCNFNGTDREFVHQLANTPTTFSAAFYNNSVYVTSMNGFKVLRYDIMEDKEETVVTYGSFIAGIKIYQEHDYKDYCPRDPCDINNGGCEDQCSTENGLVTCECLFGDLAGDSKSCVHKGPYLFVADFIEDNNATIKVATLDGTVIDRLDLSDLCNTNNNNNCSYLGVDYLTFDYKRSVLYVGVYAGDYDIHRVYAIDLVKRTAKQIDEEKDEDRLHFSLEFDPYTDRLYYSLSTGFGFYENLYDGEVRKVILSESTVVNHFAFDKDISFILMGEGVHVWNNKEVDGDYELIADDFFYREAMTIDKYNKKIYATTRTYVERMNYDGSCREIVLAHWKQRGSVSDVAYHDNMLYTSTWDLGDDVVVKNVSGIVKNATMYHKLRLQGQNPTYLYGLIMYKKQLLDKDDEEERNERAKHAKCPFRSLSDLYPFGLENGDKKLKSDDDTYGFLSLSEPMKIFSKRTPIMHINSNGLITFEDEDTSYQIEFPYSHPVLSLFGGDLVHQDFGSVFYREVKNNSLLQEISRDVNKKHRGAEGFHATQAVVATYYRLKRYLILTELPDYKLYTFQVAIASDNCTSYAVTRYTQIDKESRGAIGYYENDCNYRQFNESEPEELMDEDYFVWSLTNFTCNGTDDKCKAHGRKVLYPYGDDLDERVNATERYAMVETEDDERFPLLVKKEDEFIVHGNGFVHPGKSPDFDVFKFNEKSLGVAGFSMDYDLHDKDSHVFYRYTLNDSDRLMAYNDILRFKPEIADTKFRPAHVLVATYINMTTHGHNHPRNTFQIVLTTDEDYEELYIILNYMRVDMESYNASAGYYDNECISKELFSPNHRVNLTRDSNIGMPGRWVFKVEGDECKKTDSIHMHQSFYSNAFYSRTMNDTTRERPDGKLGAQLLQLVSGGSYASNFLLSARYMSGRAEVRHAGMVMPATPDIPKVDSYSLAIFDSRRQDPSFQYGHFTIPPFASRHHCYQHMFESAMSDKPSVKITVQIPHHNFYAFSFTNVWLRNVTESGFTICYKEQISFSGMRNLTIHYLAVTEDYHKDGVSSGSHHFDQHISKHEHGNSNMRMCERVMFDYKYVDPPAVLITPEEDFETRGGVLSSWIHSIERDHAVICTRNTLDSMEMRHGNSSVHYIIQGALDACSNHTCDPRLECHLDKETGMPYCGCKESCPEPMHGVDEELCGTDLIEYNSICEMHMGACKAYGVNKSKDVEVAYKGECKQLPYESGMIELEPVPGVPVAACEYVKVTKGVFTRFQEMSVLLTVSWNQTLYPNRSIHDATASWSEDVTIHGFKACVMVAGRHFDGLPSNPTVHWVVYQPSAIKAADDALRHRVIDLAPWYTGTRCVEILTEYMNPFAKYYVSVEHKTRQNFVNAMTAWAQREVETSMFTGATWYRHSVCVRELQNFDGFHQGIRLHVFGITAPVRHHIAEFHEVYFPEQVVLGSHPIAAVCKEVGYNGMYPVFADPAVVLTGVHKVNKQNGLGAFETFSKNDLSVWLEGEQRVPYQNRTVDLMKVCYKSIRAGIKQEPMTVNYMLFPRYCPLGWFHHERFCYKFMNESLDYEKAMYKCSDYNAAFPDHKQTMDPASSYLIRQLADEHVIWLDYHDKEQEGNFTYQGDNEHLFPNDPSMWRNGQVGGDGGNVENCLAYDSEDHEVFDEKCENDTHHFVCVKPIEDDLTKQPCYNESCSENGYCDQGTGEARCLCNPGWVGKHCEYRGSMYPECNNAMVHDNPERLFTGVKNERNDSGLCDRNFESASEWHRFEGSAGRMLFDRCTNGTDYCGVKYPGYLNGTHPQEYEGVVERKLFFYSHYCASDFGIVHIRNCGMEIGYVYQFRRMPYWSCDYGLCTHHGDYDINP